MAKVQLNALLKQLQGAIGGLVIKQTAHGPILAAKPDMSRVKWSPAQIAQRKLMRAASSHYRRTMEDPKLAAAAMARARKQKVPVSSLVMGEFMKNARRGKQSS